MGGRRCDDLYDLVEYARSFTHIFVIVGDNDVKDRKIDYILKKYLEFQNAVWPSNVKFAGNMRRGDLDPVVVTNNNIFLSENLGVNFKSAKMVKHADFDVNKSYHFNKEGHGFSRLAAMILSVFEEFVTSW